MDIIEKIDRCLFEVKKQENIIPNFKSTEEIQTWIERKSKEYGGKKKFISSDEYAKVYPEIKKINDRLRKTQKLKDKEVEIIHHDIFGGYVLKLLNKKNSYVSSGPPPNKDDFGVSSMLGGGPAKFKSEREARKFAKKYGYKVIK